MFLPPAFRVDDLAEARAMVVGMGFGHLVAISAGDTADFESTPLPVVVRGDETWSVAGHVARANPIVRCAGPALLIVPGPDTYISPSWYPSKAGDGRVVPTWNYEVVHLHGQLVIRDTPDDATWLAELLNELTDLHEQPMPRPWAVSDAPDDYIAQMTRGIVGVELVVERIEAKRKLSQNRSDDDRAGVVVGLADSPHRGATEIRRVMQHRREGDNS